MLAAREMQLLEPLPPKLRASVVKALAKPLTADGHEAPEANKALIEVFDALEMPPANGPVLLPSSLTKAQRGLALLFARREGYGCYGAPFPRTAEVRRRWLGLDPPGILEREVDFVHEGEPRRVPLWRALGVMLDQHERNIPAFLKAQKLSLLERLMLLSDVARDAYGLDSLINQVEWAKLTELRKPDKAVAAWAVREANAFGAAMAAADAPAGSARRGPRPSSIILWPIFATLLAAKIPLAPAWDGLVPGGARPAEIALLRRIAKALPETRRGPALTRALQPLWGAHFVEAALVLLADFPSRELAEGVLERADDAGAMSKREVLKALAALGKKHAIVAEVVTPAAKKQKPLLVLRAKPAQKPRDLSALTLLQQKQLVTAGKRYDGKALPAATRLSREKKHEEVSFAGLFEIIDLVDASGKPKFTALRYAVDSGTIFAAGTTRAVAAIIQFGIECEEEQLHEALTLALRRKRK
jgi:hypothetical protein